MKNSSVYYMHSFNAVVNSFLAACNLWNHTARNGFVVNKFLNFVCVYSLNKLAIIVKHTSYVCKIHKLFGIKSLKQMQVEHAGFERMNLHLDGKVAIITFPYDLKKQYGAENEDLETLIDVARSIKGVLVAAVIKQPEPENKYRVSMRSSCDFDVSEICKLYGGGGHVRAAGCTISADSILSAEMALVVTIEDRLE